MWFVLRLRSTMFTTSILYRIRRKLMSFGMPSFDIDAEQIAVLQRYYESVFNHAAELNALPKQMVHHDILVFNLLINPQSREMSGVLILILRLWTYGYGSYPFV